MGWGGSGSGARRPTKRPCRHGSLEEMDLYQREREREREREIERERKSERERERDRQTERE